MNYGFGYYNKSKEIRKRKIYSKFITQENKKELIITKILIIYSYVAKIIHNDFSALIIALTPSYISWTS